MKHGHGALIAVVVIAVAVWLWWEYTVQLKSGVTLQGVQWPVIFGLGVAAATRQAVGGGDLTVTSTTDGVHPAGGATDPHYLGLAADLRTNDIADSIIQAWYAALAAVLKPLGFHVVPETDHINIQFWP